MLLIEYSLFQNRGKDTKYIRQNHPFKTGKIFEKQKVKGISRTGVKR